MSINLTGLTAGVLSKTSYRLVIRCFAKLAHVPVHKFVYRQYTNCAIHVTLSEWLVYRFYVPVCRSVRATGTANTYRYVIVVLLRK